MTFVSRPPLEYSHRHWSTVPSVPGDRLTMKYKDEVLAERRLMDVSQVSLFGNVMISAQALRELTTRGIPVCHLTCGGWFHGLTSGLVHKNIELRIRQFEIAADAQRSLQIARCFISGKIRFPSLKDDGPIE